MAWDEEPPRRLWDEVLHLAEQQHGAIATFQLREIGLDKHQALRMRKSSQWLLATPQVLVRRGSSRGRHQHLMVAVLDAGEGAFLSHSSAAWLWGHRGSRWNGPIHVVTTAVGDRTAPGVRRHRVRALPPEWVTELEGIPVVRPEMVALQLFATNRYERAERIVEWMWANRLLSGASIGGLLNQLGRRGRNGTAGLRRYHDARGDGYVPAGSGLETRALQILEDAGLHFRRQVDLGNEERWHGRVDLLHAELPLVIEVQSEAHHSALVDRRCDETRTAALRAAGFVLVEVTDTVVWTDPAELVRRARHGIDIARHGRHARHGRSVMAELR